ncbi:HNH endonuclease [Bacteroides thetaiotaomicron]|uniref:HNH endonuclease n=1 Tax=Bacteroides thetaiotaomicron TaxID=818 RepID=UPI0039C1BAB3
MKQVSSKQAQRNREVAKIKQSLSPFCAICGKPAVDAAHLIPKSMYPEHYTNPQNIVGLCREYHNRYDNNLAFRRRQKRLIERVKSFDECAANRYFRL